MPARPMREFFGVLPLAAVALLALNDFVLKAAFHNALTGKLSDFAGCFFLPLYLSALLSLAGWRSLRSRLALAAGFTVALFGAVKLSSIAGAAVCAAVALAARPLGIGALHIVTDRTDLVALAMVPCAWLYATTRLEPPQGDPAP